MSGFSDEPIGSPPGGGPIPAGPIVAGAQLIGNLYDSYQTRKTARENTDKTIAANKEQSELAYQRELEMWNLQNAYNTPAAQMERFKAAGLNPHLIYGQGNAGNASSPVRYQKPDIQYRYAAGNYGEAIASVLPTLMSVGTWLQQMRLSEVEIEKRSSEADRVQQLVDYLTKANPESLQKLRNEVTMFPYQRDFTQARTNTAVASLQQMIREYMFQYGEKMFPSYDHERGKLGVGMKDVQLERGLLENMIKESEEKLKSAQASWTDEFGMAGTPAIVQLVLSGIMGMAGQTLRAAPKLGKPSPTPRSVNPRLSRTITNYERGGRRVVKRNYYDNH